MTDYWKGRSRTYQSSYRNYSKNFKPPADRVSPVPPPPLGKLIQALDKHDLEKDATSYTDKASIQDCKLVASYNWLDKNDPTIIVPGKPPRWTPLPGEIKLLPDSGDYFVDKNGARFPSHLMESTALAVLSLANPNIPADLDIVACSSSLGNLLRFALGEDKSFRILVQAVDGSNTVFFARRENSPTEKHEDYTGFGHTFPEAYTAWDPEAKGSDTSYRILGYRFGGLRMLVRAEVDAYVAREGRDGAPPPAGRSKAAHSASTTPTTTADVADLGQLVSELRATTSQVAPRPPAASPSAAKISTVSSTCAPVAQSQVLEIKTRSRFKRDVEDTVAKEIPKLWLAQIPSLVVAYHDKGKFNFSAAQPEESPDMRVQDVRGPVERWERVLARRELAGFAALINRVVAVVRARPDGKVELRREGTGGLEIREQGAGAGELLSEEMKGRWAGIRKGSGEAVGPGTGEDELVAGGAEMGIGDEDAWDDEEDWTFCSGECGYCGRCKK